MPSWWVHIVGRYTRSYPTVDHFRARLPLPPKPSETSAEQGVGALLECLTADPGGYPQSGRLVPFGRIP